MTPASGYDEKPDRDGGVAVRNAARNPVLVHAALAMSEGRLHEAEPALRNHLRQYPSDVAAIRMLAELATRIGRLNDANRLLDRALDLAPDFHAARELRARNLQQQHDPGRALADTAILRRANPQNESTAMLHAALLVAVGEQRLAEPLYREILARHAGYAAGWMCLGHVLKALGRLDEGVGAYRRALECQPTLGEAWWSLANLKIIHFSENDCCAMETALAQAATHEDRYHLLFALAKAMEDLGNLARAAILYRQANSARRESQPHDSGAVHAKMTRRARSIRDRAAQILVRSGCPASDPIFIVGLPRAGSTLVEQILASHSQIEGTAELPVMMTLIGECEATGQDPADLPEAERKRLGEEYMARTRCYRHEDKPYFIDKLPNNFGNIALIKAILPNARIIDARRHPLDCGLSIWRQNFARGQSFGYDLADIGQYYRDYVAFMNIVDEVMPGVVHRVIHERLVHDTEGEVRALLGYLELPYEAACLDFWRNPRPVRTPSSEQVRRSINADALGYWQRFDEELAPLKQALGPVLLSYPEPAAVTEIWSDF